MLSPSVSRRAKTPPNYHSLCETAFEQLISTISPFVTKKAVQTYAVQFSATVTAFDNSFLSTAAKVDLAGAADAVGDRGGIVRIIGLSAAGAYQYEDLALNAGDSSVATPSVNTYSKVFALQNRHSGAWTTAQNITCKQTTTANVICTLPSGSIRYVKVTSALNIPRHYGTFTGTPASGGTYVTDAGWFNAVTAVYNVTDDAPKTVNLIAAAGFDQVEDLTGGFSPITDGFSVGTQNAYLATGLGVAKTYEVQGSYVPYQGILDGSETLEIVYGSPLIHASSSGTGTPTTGTIWANYVPVSVKLPLTNAYDEASLVRADISVLSGGKAFGAVAAGRRVLNTGFEQYPYAGMSITLGAASNRRGRISALSGATLCSLGHTTAVTTLQVVGAWPAIVRVVSCGTNTSISVNELLLLIIGTTGNASGIAGLSAVDAYKLSSTGVFY